jgi:pilus assembly protein CpaE
MADKIKTLIISKMADRRQALHAMLSGDDIVSDTVESSTLALDKINTMNPDIVIMATGNDEDSALSLCERIYFSKPKSTVVIISEYLDLQILQTFMRAGARDVINWPDNQQVFINFIKTLYNNQSTHQSAMLGEKQIDVSSQVISVFGTKGGTGKTAMAVNLAVKLAQMKKRVALLDFNLQFGDASVFLDIDATDTIAELVQSQNTLNIETIKKFMVLHSSGIYLLSAPKSPEYADVITPKHIEKIISTIRPYFDYIIIDLPARFNDVTLMAIETSILVLYVISLEISVLRNAKIGLQLLDSLQQKEKIRLVVNRESESSITVNDIGSVLDCPIVGRFPSEWKEAITALNKGIPFVQCMPKSKLSLSMEKMIETLFTKKEPTNNRLMKRNIKR